MKTICMLSNRHVHLSEDNAKLLFGENGITFDHHLNGNRGPWASKEQVTIVGPKGAIEKVRVLGPCREYNQIEVLKSDCYRLGIDPPVRNSGDLEGAATLKVIGPCGEIDIPGAIIAFRHIHVGADICAENGWTPGETLVSVKTEGTRSVVFNNVRIVKGGRGLLMHIDTEEGNAAGVKNGDMLEIIG